MIKILILTILFSISVLNSANVPEAPEESQGKEIYQSAKKLIFEDKWDEARDQLQELIEKYPKDPYVDDAMFWIAYSYEKEEKLEEAFKTYQDMRNRFSSSKYSEDAQANSIRIARQLADEGEKKYLDFLAAISEDQKNSETDIKLQALFALGQQEHADIIPLVKNILNSDNNPRMKEQALFVLGQSDKKEATELLKEIAGSDEKQEIREKAIFWLGQKEEPGIAEFLRDLTINSDYKIAEKAIFSLSQNDSPEALEYLYEISKKSDNSKLQEKAIFWIGQSESGQSLKYLSNLYDGNFSEAIKEKIIFSISQIESPLAINKIKAIASDSKNQSLKLREKAVFWLSQSDDKSIVDFFTKILSKDENEELKGKVIFSLSQLDSPEAIEKLYEIAKSSKNPELRKKSIFWLAEKEDKRVLGWLIGIFKDEEMVSVKKKILFSISQMESSGKSIEFLVDVAKNDGSRMLRKEAIQTLGMIDSKQAQEALRKIISE